MQGINYDSLKRELEERRIDTPTMNALQLTQAENDKLKAEIERLRLTLADIATCLRRCSDYQSSLNNDF